MKLQYRDWYGTPYWSEREWQDKRYPIRYLVMHDTEGPRDAAFSWWASPDNPYRSSAHDLIDKSGVIWRCVPYEKAAHHAGYAHIEGFNRLNPETGREEPNANLVSIGVELEYPVAPASPPWPQVQLDVAVVHARRIVLTYGIPRENVFTHHEIDPKRKTDPRNFDWEGFLDRVYQGVDPAMGQALRNAAWNAGGIPYNRDAAFPKYAREHNLGNPETQEFDFAINGREYRGQGFSRGIIYAPVGEWDDIKEVTW